MPQHLPLPGPGVDSVCQLDVNITVKLCLRRNWLRFDQRAVAALLVAVCTVCQSGFAGPHVADDAAQLEQLLTDLDPQSQKAADAVPRLIAAIQDETVSPTLRRQAGMTLGRIGEPARRAVPVLMQLAQGARSRDADVRFWAAKSVGLFGSLAAEAVPALSADLADRAGTPEDRILVADVLGQIGTAAAVQELARELLRKRESTESPETLLLEVAVDAIAQAGVNGIVALPALIRVTAHHKSSVRRKACVAIGRLGPRAELSLDPLLERLVLDDDPAVRDAAAAAMARIGPAAVPLLIRLVGSGEPELQWRAAHALQRIGPRADAALAALQKSAKDDDVQVRIESLDAIWRISGDSEAIALPMVQELSTSDRQLRRRASQLLIELRPLSAAAVSRLRKIAGDGSHDAARTAGYVLREIERRGS